MATEYRLVLRRWASIGPYQSPGYAFASVDYGDRNIAIKEGRAWFGDEGWHLATLRDGRLVAFAYDEDDWEDGEVNLASIAEQLGITAR